MRIVIALIIAGAFTVSCASGKTVSSTLRETVHAGHAAGGVLGFAAGIVKIVSGNPIEMAAGVFNLAEGAFSFDDAKNKKVIIDNPDPENQE